MPKTTRLMPKLLGLLLLGFVAAAAADVDSAISVDEHYEIGPGDLLVVKVFGTDVFDAKDYVSNSGRIHIPRLGVISVSGETTTSLASRLTQELIAKDLLVDPMVSVDIAESHSRPVYVLGEVMMPGQYMMSRTLHVSDLIGLANGIASSAGPVGYFYRRTKVEPPIAASGESESAPATLDTSVDDVKIINLEDLYSDPTVDIELQGGDIFYIPIPRVQYFYVIGDVQQPGMLEMPREGSVAGVRALAMAGGPLRTAKLAQSVLVSRDQNGSVSYDDINMKRIFDGEESDVVLRPGQILFVPGSATKTLGLGLLKALPGVQIY